mmetsp:Transcript_2859/g.4448  ORF Transcript_2859/g.4448 Transcript_2859/m.4448 type:complete len:135 (-) Transcript_2859:32-436(-)
MNYGETEEDASKIQLGPDFENAQCLLYSEVSLTLEEYDGDEVKSEVFMKTLKYTQKFSAFKTSQDSKEVRNVLSRNNLNSYEIAAMGNLTPRTPNEAFALIPTLNDKFDNKTQEMETLLNDMSRYQSSFIFEEK